MADSELFYLGFWPSDDPGKKKARAFRRGVRRVVAEVVPVADMHYRLTHPDESVTVFGRRFYGVLLTGACVPALPPLPPLVHAYGPISGRLAMIYHLVGD